MSGFPPPPPPPSGQPGGPPPNWAAYTAAGAKQAWRMQREAMKAQARAARAQAKMQRSLIRMQRRALRRGSTVGPLVLLALGIVFLMGQLGHLSWGYALSWYGRWWPMVLVGAGIVLLAEWALDSARHDAQGRPLGSRHLGAGVVFLLIFLAIVGWSLRFNEPGMAWNGHSYGLHFEGLEHVFGEQHDADDSLSSAMAAGGTLVIRSARGDVQVAGSSDDGQVHVSVHKQAWSWDEGEADRKEQQLQPVFSNDGNHLVLTLPTVEDGQADLTIQMPREAGLTVQADHGDITVSDLHGAVELSANHGDVDISEIDGGVTAHINDDNAGVSMKTLKGDVTISGRTGDVNLADVAGAVTMQGDFFGTTHLERVNGAVRFETTRTQFSSGRIDGEFEVERGSLQTSETLGPVVLVTSYKNITLDRVQGSIEVRNKNGSVEVTQASPLAPIGIENEHGSVDVGVAGGSGFVLNATTKHGDMENDFGLNEQDSGGLKTLAGTVEGGGTQVRITTTEGDVTVRKSTVAPLPPVPPAPTAPAVPPPAPAAPKAKVAPMPKAPAAPRPPNKVKAPASVTF